MNNELKELINKIIESSDCQNDKQLVSLKNELMKTVLDCFSEKLSTEDSDDIKFISSDYAIIELKDDKTNKLFRRSVPLSYVENSNGIRLCGENFKGQASEIVFLSKRATDKINDLLGHGPDHDQCH